MIQENLITTKLFNVPILFRLYPQYLRPGVQSRADERPESNKTVRMEELRICMMEDK